jgi:hypothetical protein
MKNSKKEIVIKRIEIFFSNALLNVRNISELFQKQDLLIKKLVFNLK